jgi:small subunit ribosomal protein S17e
VNRVRRISEQLMKLYPDKFSSDYESNKKVISELAIIRSKLLRNEIVGYITRHYKMLEEEKESGQKEEASQAPMATAEAGASSSS